jgi:hypothetical protein
MIVYNIMGLKGSGKDTIADLIEDQIKSEGNSVERVSFADALKTTCWDLFGEAVEKEERFWGSIKDKQETIPTMSIPVEMRAAIPILRDHEFWTGRLILQFMGTEACRSIYDQVWVSKARRIIKEYIRMDAQVTITDCRFPNEYDMISKLCEDRITVVTMMVKRPGYECDGHESEVHIPTFQADIVINNDGTLDDLKNTVTRLFRKEDGLS